ncbi:hypothetical protein QG516_09775 [Pedobacter gandavensis]|uniref:hypothetical protein n=1 Tax=Pedobacter TaxID=84567 RepID=UPI0021042D8A|nr:MULTISPECIES: hypothetical protein [Pedobacter]WGQ11925.1 hypothetical protein QG516_09775 [Pedobacter gandavensis]
MKVKLTPLNIISAVCITIAAVLLFEKRPPSNAHTINLQPILIGFSLLIAVIAFISDQIFRKFIPELKKIWIVECTVILFTVLLFVIIKVSIN